MLPGHAGLSTGHYFEIWHMAAMMKSGTASTNFFKNKKGLQKGVSNSPIPFHSNIYLCFLFLYLRFLQKKIAHSVERLAIFHSDYKKCTI